MGLTLELYALSGNALREILGCGDAGLLATMSERIRSRMEYGVGSGPSQDEAWLRPLGDLVLGPLGRALHERRPFDSQESAESVGAATAEAFASLIRVRGESVGTVRHRSRVSGAFMEFLEKNVPRALGRSPDFRLLCDRPLFGIRHDDLPAWGGLSRLELEAIVGGMSADRLPELPEADWGAVLFDVWDAVAAAHARGGDLLTVYF